MSMRRVCPARLHSATRRATDRARRALSSPIAEDQYTHRFTVHAQHIGTSLSTLNFILLITRTSPSFHSRQTHTHTRAHFFTESIHTTLTHIHHFSLTDFYICIYIYTHTHTQSQSLSLSLSLCVSKYRTIRAKAMPDERERRGLTAEFRRICNWRRW